MISTKQNSTDKSVRTSLEMQLLVVDAAGTVVSSSAECGSVRIRCFMI